MSLTSLWDYYAKDKVLSLIESSIPMSRAGPILTPESFKEDSIERFSVHLSCSLINFFHKKWPSSSRIYFALVDRPDVVNASAMKLPNGSYAIVLYMGMIDRLLTVATAICRTTEGSKFLGLDNVEHPITEENYKSTKRSGGIPVSDLDFSRDGLLGLTALRLYLGMLGACIFHEAGHILDGHLELLMELNPLYELRGVTLAASEESKILTKKALEFDADCFSAVGWIKLSYWIMDGEEFRVPDVLSGLWRSQSQFIEFMFFSECCSYIFESTLPFANKDNGHLDDVHASDSFRSWTTLLTMMSTTHNDPTSFEHNQSALATIFWISVRCSIMVAGTDAPNGYQKDFEDFSESFGNYISLINGRWATIRDRLMIIKTTKHKLAPAQANPI